MTLIKHVDGVDIEMTPEEEAQFLADLPKLDIPAPGDVANTLTKDQLLLEIKKLSDIIKGLP